jgi:hypothetical protein
MNSGEFILARHNNPFTSWLNKKLKDKIFNIYYIFLCSCAISNKMQDISFMLEKVQNSKTASDKAQEIKKV